MTDKKLDLGGRLSKLTSPFQNYNFANNEKPMNIKKNASYKQFDNKKRHSV